MPVMWHRNNAPMEAAELLVIAVDHPSLHGRLTAFLDELRSERRCDGRTASMSRTPFPALIDQLAAEQTMRLGVMAGSRLIAMAAVDNDGAVAVAVVHDHRRRGIANELMKAVTERAAAIGYPPLHRFTAPRARLAG
jgi:GNAT superfamily N-acetyltransferase